MDTNKFIDSFLASANAFDTRSFLAHWHKDAILNDPSVGRKFNGHKEIQQYFEDYFIGYNTQTALVSSQVRSPSEVYLEVSFTGTFSEGKLGGRFDLVLEGNKIATGTADLLH